MASTSFVSMEEFEAENADLFKELETREALKKQSSKERKNATMQKTGSPVPIGSPRTSEHSINFNHMCQEKRVVPEWTFAEPFHEQFEASVRIGGGEEVVVVKSQGLFRSKKEAKENTAFQACAVMKKMQMPGGGGGSGGGKGDDGDAIKENYIGKVLEFTNATKTPGAVYQDFSLGQYFACELTLSQRPDQAFGKRTAPFNSKKAARQNAAKDAIFWLVEMRLIDDINGPIRKKKVLPPPPKTQKTPVDSPMADPKTQQKEADHGEKTYSDRVTEMCNLLGLNTPHYRITQSTPDSSIFFSAGAYFPQNPEIQSPLGVVDKIYSRKATKEECAKRAYLVLRSIYEERMKEAQELLRAVGCEDVVIG